MVKYKVNSIRCSRISFSPASRIHHVSAYTTPTTGSSFLCLSGNRDLDLNPSLDIDNDLLHELSGSCKAGFDLAKTVNRSESRNAYSMRRLCMRISNVSQVLLPSPLPWDQHRVAWRWLCNSPWRFPGLGGEVSILAPAYNTKSDSSTKIAR